MNQYSKVLAYNILTILASKDIYSFALNLTLATLLRNFSC